MENKKPTDTEIIAEWRSMLKLFDGILGLDQNDSARQQYEELIRIASASNVMTPRQKNGIVDRCNYRISLIVNTNKKPFANVERQVWKLSHEQSNGKTQ